MAISHVQSYANTGTSSGTSVTFPAFTAVGSGNAIAGVLVFHNIANIISSISAGGNALSIFDFNYYSGAAYSAIGFALAGVTGGPTTITVTFTTTPTGTDHYLQFDEYSGATAIGQHASSNVISSGSTTSLSTSITTTTNGDMIWTALDGVATPTVPSGFTGRNSDSTHSQWSAEFTQATAGLIQPTWTFSTLVSGAAAFIQAIALSPTALPAALISFGTPYKYNTGYPAKYVNSDVWATTWADDGNLYTASDDSSGWQGAAPSSNVMISKLDGFTTSLTGTLVNVLAAWGTAAQAGSDSATYKAMGLISVGGVLYCSMARQVYGNFTTGVGTAAKQSSANLQIIKSSDHGVTWTPTPPSTAAPYVSPMFSGSVNSICWPIQYGKDYSGQTVDLSNIYLYAVSNDGFWNNGSSLYLGRVLLSNLPNLSGADWTYYQGGDGTLSANWGAWATAQPIISNSLKVSSNGVQYVSSLGVYIHIQWWYPSIVNNVLIDPSVTQWDIYQAPHPWGPWSIVTSVVWNSEPGKGLYNPNIIPSSISGKTAVISAAGDFNNVDPQTGDYTLTLVPVTFNFGASVGNKDYGNGFLVSNASATQGPFSLLGGKYGVSCNATFGGGSVSLQVLGPDGSTYVNVLPAFTANGVALLDLPPGLYQVAISTASAVNISVIPVSKHR